MVLTHLVTHLVVHRATCPTTAPPSSPTNLLARHFFPKIVGDIAAAQNVPGVWGLSRKSDRSSTRAIVLRPIARLCSAHGGSGRVPSWGTTSCARGLQAGPLTYLLLLPSAARRGVSRCRMEVRGAGRVTPRALRRLVALGGAGRRPDAAVGRGGAASGSSAPDAPVEAGVPGDGSFGGGSLGNVVSTVNAGSAGSVHDSLSAVQDAAVEMAALKARASRAERELALAAEEHSALSMALAAEVGRLRLSNAALSSSLDAERVTARGWVALLSSFATAIALPLVALALLAIRSSKDSQLAQQQPPRRLLSGGMHAVDRACAVAPQTMMTLSAALACLGAAVLLRVYSWHSPVASPRKDPYGPVPSLSSRGSSGADSAPQQSNSDSASSTTSISTGVRQEPSPRVATSQPCTAPGESANAGSCPNLGAMRSSTIVSRMEDAKSKVKNGSVSPEFGLCTDHWLNFTAGLALSVEETAAFRAMSPSEATTFTVFKDEVRQRLAACADIDRERHFTEPDDVTTLKFLQADKYDTSRAIKRLLLTVVWRQKIDLDRLVRERPAAIETYRRLRVRRLMGHDINGRPVFVERVGEFIANLGSAQARALSPQDWIDCCVYDMAHLICAFRASVKLGPPQMRQVFIADCAGVTVVQAVKSVKLLQAMASATGPNFPEMLDSVILVNVSSVVHSCWGLVKKILDPVVVAKIQMHTTFPTAYVLRFLAKESLFAEYGGENQADYPHAGSTN